MKFIIYIILLITFSTNAISEEEFRGWPSTLDNNSRFYRGQRENLANFDRLARMLVQRRDDLFITSRLFRTIEKRWPPVKTKRDCEPCG